MRIYAIGLAVLLTGCGGAGKKPVRNCEVRGQVLRVDPQVRTATIRHQKICDWMEPMTMEFPVREQADFDRLQPGKRIRATVYIGDPEYWLAAVQVEP